MKTVEEIITQPPVFLGEWKTEDEVFRSFDIKPQIDIHVCFAAYSLWMYEGVAFVLFSQNGKLYEVNGSHCSCYGLEDQWDPEEVVLAEMRNRLLNGTFGICIYEEGFNEELREFLGIKKEDLK
ncbi:MAG: hypothetical protein UGF45_09865 [Massilioclostridium sp.]|nr:hypothetical protein [Massilioclostridium sp.]MEE1492293.1 hypothetical protein [Massilioclostridium sp.]